MSVAIRVWWPEGRFDGATLDPTVGEWPPAPARLFSALRAGARTAAEMTALEWLEVQPPPVIFADETPLEEFRTEGYVVINSVSQTGGNLTHPGRTNGLRARAGVHLSDERVVFAWPDADADTETLITLNRLAADVPYLGRSTSPVVISVEPADVPDAPNWHPTALGLGVRLAIPYPGFSAELDDVHATGARAWERYRYQGYAFGDRDHREAPLATPPARSPYASPLIFRLDSSGFLPSGVAGLLTTALRRAVMALVPDPLPSELHGHGADGRPHVAFLALADVGHRHADGHLLGVAVCAPADQPAIGDVVARSLLGEDPEEPILRRLEVPGIGVLELRFDPTAEFPRGAHIDRWVRPSRTWTTAIPMVLDRFPRRNLSTEATVALGVTQAGYPEPVQVKVSTTPLLAGAQHPRPHQIPRKREDRRPYRHVRLTFAEPVRGPVLVGALRHLGFGLCAPSSLDGRS